MHASSLSGQPMRRLARGDAARHLRQLSTAAVRLRPALTPSGAIPRDLASFRVYPTAPREDAGLVAAPMPPALEWASAVWDGVARFLPKGFGGGRAAKKEGDAGKEGAGDGKEEGGKARSEGKKADKAGGGGGGGKGKKDEEPTMDPVTAGVSAAALAYALYKLFGSQRPDGLEISWQEFRNTFLATGMVDRLEVVNKEHVRVYLRNTPNYAVLESAAAAEGGGAGGTAMGGAGGSSGFAAAIANSSGGGLGGGASSGDPYATSGGSDVTGALAGLLSPEREAELRRAMEASRGRRAHFFRIGSVEGFERQLEDSQLDLGIRPRDFVLVRHVAETDVGSRLMSVAPSLLLVALYFMAFRSFGGGGLGAGAGGLGGGRDGIGRMFSIGKAKPTVVNKDTKVKVTFADVAGCDEAKAEIMEFVQFLKDPTRFTQLGAKIPKGALLVGPPGTGKTLLAKATAGEASVPFFSMSGSDFIEMFVGVGPSRVRDLFAQARAAAPSIIFIDEIDAVARSRNKGGFSGGNDERENTLNQLLVEMDGFASTEGVVVLAGTNRADILDKAILRPGRFDRQIQVDKPDIKGRKQIFQVHMDKVKIAGEKEAYSQRLAALTPGFVGADIANICNEAAIHAARGSKEKVDLRDFEAAIDRVIGGLERRNSLMTPDEKRTVAFHEAGHAIAGWFLEHADPLLKVTIIPRGKGALGFAQYLPKEVTLFSREALVDRMCMALGGRASEELNFGRITTGASDDLDKVTQMAYAMTTVYGMNSRVGNLSFRREENQFDKPYSEATAQVIDEEVRKLVDDCYARTKALLDAHADKVKAVAELLLERETISQRDLEALAGQRPYPVNEGLKQYVHSMFDDSEDAKPKEADKDGKKKEGEEKEAAGADGPIPAAACAGDVKLR